MKALVCISHVPDTTSKIRFTDDNTKFDTTDIQYIIGPHEELGLTRLLEIDGLEITVVNVGPKETEATLRKALAMGAKDAVRVDAEPGDALFVAKQIAEVYKKGDYDFILTGKESIDYNGGMVDGMLSALLGLPGIPNASKFEIDGDKIHYEREIDGGHEKGEATFPLVTSCGKGFAIEPKIPGMRGIMMARKKPLEVMEAIDTKINTTVNKYNLPESKGECKLVDAEDTDELVRLLNEEAKVI
ncbi:MAG: electron transfer flavoprotein subunit beta/FixA family protein [Bacteroidota bacterium]|nr:electron transfer flavoprotein subunit beta/FixA family protein [Bacteroidota bacterium]